MRRFHLSAAALCTAALVLSSCTEQQLPTSPGANPSSGEVQLLRGGVKPRAERGGPNRENPATWTVTTPEYTAKAALTKVIVADNGDLRGQVTVLVTRASDGATATVVDTTSLAIAGHTNINAAPAVASAAKSRTTQAAVACDIINLDLGPLDLNILGLEVHLQEVILDIVAVTGAGNLLGNLLCAVVGLFDGVAAIAAILNLIDVINTLLGSLAI